MSWAAGVGDRIWVVFDVDDPARNMAWPPVTDHASVERLVRELGANDEKFDETQLGEDPGRRHA